MTNSLFIGLVTHPHSRFPVASSPDGLMGQLQHALECHGWSIKLTIESDNRIREGDLNLDRAHIRAAIGAEIDVEQRWWEFQHQHSLPMSNKVSLLLRKAYRMWRFAGPTQSSHKKGRSMLIRLANIEAAHLSLMTQAIESQAKWVLILEDDAESTNVTELAQQLAINVDRWNSESQPQYVNISDSFALADLNVDHNLDHIGRWDAVSNLYSARRPFTNTVCAILYRDEFLRQLLNALNEIPMQPIVPIDWKVNDAIMNLSHTGVLGPGDCYTVDPGPIRQASMHGYPWPSRES